jgi:hypothetical protein
VAQGTYMGPQGRIETKYWEDPADIEVRDQNRKQLMELMPQIGRPSQAILDESRRQEETYRAAAMDKFNKEYDKTYKALREDVGARFGTLSVTPFTDQLGELERDIKQPAYNDIIRSSILMGKDFVNQEEMRKLQQLQALGGMYSGSLQQQLAGLPIGLQLSQQGNNWAQNNYMGQLQAYQSRLAANASRSQGGGLGSSLLSAIPGIISGIAAF